MTSRNGVGPTKRRVLVVGDSLLVRHGLVALINLQPDLLVCGLPATVPEAIAVIETLKPDIALLDLSFSGASGMRLVKLLRSRADGVPILAISIHEEALYAERVLRAGARGYLMEPQAGERVVDAIRQVLSGEIYLSEQMISRILHKLVEGADTSHVALESLSDRELEVFQMIGEGLGTREIAERLRVSTKTVETYRMQIRRRLVLRNAAALVQRAAEWVAEKARAASRPGFDVQDNGPRASVGPECRR
jgi:DNA-binding NarL/FixJ family response regulator